MFLWILWILCEIYSLLAMIIFFTQRAQRAQSFIYLPCFTLALEWSQTSLRQECAEFLSTPSPLRGTPACLRGRKWVLAVVTAPSHRGEGLGRGLFPKKPLHPSPPGAGRELIVSSRPGPRMESSVNMN